MLTNFSVEDCKKPSPELYVTAQTTSLSLMSIESEILEDIDFHDIVRSFAENKSRKKYF